MYSVNQEQLLSLFCDLVKIDSPSLCERGVADYIKSFLNNLGVTVTEDNAGELIGGNAGNLYAFIDGDSSRQPILFCAHMDTVEPSKNKTPIILSNGKITSDSTTVLGADDFAGVSSILEAVRAIIQNDIPHPPIELLFTASEENYCKGISQLDFSRLKARQAYIFDLSGNVGACAYSAPTIISFTSQIHGKASHAGFAYNQGVHSILAMADALSKIKCGQIDDETTVNIGTISGGTATNIVPELCTISGEIRSLDDKKASDEYDKITEQLTSSAQDFGATVSFSFTRHITAYNTDLSSAVCEHFSLACKSIGLEPNFIKTFGGSDNNVLSLHGIDGLVVATAMNDCHSVNEWTTVEELTKASNLALALMVRS